MRNIRFLLMILLFANPFLYGETLNKAEERISEQAPDNQQTNVPGIQDYLEQKEEDDVTVINKIVAVIYGDEASEIVTKFDCERSPFGQGNINPEDALTERVFYMAAQALKITIDDDAIDQYLAKVQQQFDLTRDGLESIFRSAGYTMMEGREYFRRIQSIQRLLDYRVKSHIIVSKEDVEKYYQEHPVVEPALCVLQRGVISFAKKKSVAQQKHEIEEAITRKKILKNVEWSDPFEVTDGSIVTNKRYLLEKDAGYISSPEEIKGMGFEVFRVKKNTPEKVKPLIDRYNEIVAILQAPLYRQLMESYKKELFEKASISILDFSFFKKEFLQETGLLPKENGPVNEPSSANVF